MYSFFQQLLISPLYNDEELLLIKKRWEFIHTESMGFAYVLNPKTKGGLGMMGEDLEETYDNLRNFFDNDDEINKEFDRFIQLVAEPSSAYARLFESKSFDPRTWWLVHGKNKFSSLAKLACKVFAIPTSSASSERVWSVFNLIHSKKRCRLKNQTVNKLAYVYVNSQLVVDQEEEASEIDYFLQQINGEDLDCIVEDEFDGTDDADA